MAEARAGAAGLNACDRRPAAGRGRSASAGGAVVRLGIAIEVLEGLVIGRLLEGVPADLEALIDAALRDLDSIGALAAEGRRTAAGSHGGACSDRRDRAQRAGATAAAAARFGRAGLSAVSPAPCVATSLCLAIRGRSVEWNSARPCSSVLHYSRKGCAGPVCFRCLGVEVFAR